MDLSTSENSKMAKQMVKDTNWGVIVIEKGIFIKLNGGGVYKGGYKQSLRDGMF